MHSKMCLRTPAAARLSLCSPIIHLPGHIDSLRTGHIWNNRRLVPAPLLLAARHGILPYYICRSCAYAYLYRNKRYPQSIQLQEMLARDGIEATAAKVSGLDPQVAEQKLVLDLIVCAYGDNGGQDPLENSN